MSCWKEKLPREAELGGLERKGSTTEAMFSETSGGLLGPTLSSVLQFETAALGLSPMAFLGLPGLTALSRPLSSCEMPCL